MNRIRVLLVILISISASAYCQNLEDIIASAHSHYNEADIDIAYELFEKATVIAPDYYDGWFYKGHSAILLRKYPQAIDAFTRCISIDPANPHAWFSRAMAKMELGRFEDAIGDFTRTIELDSTFVEAYYQRGICRHEINHTKGFCDDMYTAKMMGYPFAEQIFTEYCD